MFSVLFSPSIVRNFITTHCFPFPVPAQPFSPLPVPSWQLNKPLSLATVAKVTDAYLASLQPARKLKLPVVPEAVKKSLSSFAASLGQPSKGSAVTDMVTAALADQAVVEEGGKVLPGFTVSFLISPEPNLLGCTVVCWHCFGCSPSMYAMGANAKSKFPRLRACMSYVGQFCSSIACFSTYLIVCGSDVERIWIAVELHGRLCQCGSQTDHHVVNVQLVGTCTPHVPDACMRVGR